MHQPHIIPELLMMVLMVFEDKGEKYNLLVIMIALELYEIVLQHKLQYNLMKYEMVYNVHAVMHVQQLNLMLIDGKINCDLKVLKMNKMMRLLHLITLQFWFDIRKRKRKKKKTMTAETAASQQQ